MHPAEIHQQLHFESSLRFGQRVLATCPLMEGQVITFPARVYCVMRDWVVVKAEDDPRLPDETPEEIVIPRFTESAWSTQNRVEPREEGPLT